MAAELGVSSAYSILRRARGHEEREFAVGFLWVFSGRVGRGGLHCGWLGDGAG